MSAEDCPAVLFVDEVAPRRRQASPALRPAGGRAGRIVLPPASRRAGPMPASGTGSTPPPPVWCCSRAARDAAPHEPRLRGASSASRQYAAVVYGHLARDDGEIDLPLAEDADHRPRQVVDPLRGWARSPATACSIARGHDADAISRLELKPVTGRAHQLRVTCAPSGHPILGDALYAPPESAARFARMHLHATRIAFMHPHTRVPMLFDSPAPSEAAPLATRGGVLYIVPSTGEAHDDPLPAATRRRPVAHRVAPPPAFHPSTRRWQLAFAAALASRPAADGGGMVRPSRIRTDLVDRRLALLYLPNTPMSHRMVADGLRLRHGGELCARADDAFPAGQGRRAGVDRDAGDHGVPLLSRRPRAACSSSRRSAPTRRDGGEIPLRVGLLTMGASLASLIAFVQPPGPCAGSWPMRCRRRMPTFDSSSSIRW